ncbi:MAG: ATP-binding protein [Balneolaceae bacterium]
MKISSKHLSVLYSMTPDQFNAVEMHSFLNVINVIHLQLDLLKIKIESGNLLQPILDQTFELSKQVKNKNHQVFLPGHIKTFQETVYQLLDLLDSKCSDTDELAELNEAKQVLTDVFKVMDIRSNELLQITTNPGQWIQYSIAEFKDDFNTFFHAVEKNSKGRYRIVQNIAIQESNDYLIHFDVDSVLNGKLIMPIIFKDVIRDLIANARKYTNPGGSIHIGVYQKNNLLRFIVEDHGIGIPKKEIDNVFEYGYRANNVKHIQTMGGGFGLTKALYITVQLNGDMWIESTLNEGTKIIIEIPVPEKYVHAVNK